jgi:phage portal protein BeeE
MLSGYIPMSQLSPGPPDYPFGNLVGGMQWPLGFNTTQGGGKTEQIQGSFQGLVQGAYARNGVVFAVEMARLSLFAQARFNFQMYSGGRPGDFAKTPPPALLEHPWPSATLGDLLARMLQDADFAGDAFAVRQHGQLRRLRPDWVVMLLGSEEDKEMAATDPMAEVIGILYFPGGPGHSTPPEVFLPGEFAHFSPIPDPLGFQRGMSWLAPVVSEVMGDEAATAHKLKFFENGATVNLVIDMDPGLPREKFNEWVRTFEEGHKGLASAYKTLYMAGGAKATPIGSSMRDMDFSELQGRAEVRICIAGGVPPTVVGVSEGLQGSSLNAGNYASAMQHFAATTMNYNWGNWAGSMEALFPAGPGRRLWFDPRDIPALKDDIKDAATVQQTQVSSLTQLVRDGYTPASAAKFITSGDFDVLKHTGLFSVQLQAPGAKGMPEGEAPGQLPLIGTKPAELAPGDAGPGIAPGTKPPANGKTPAAILKPLTGKKVAP